MCDCFSTEALGGEKKGENFIFEACTNLVYHVCIEKKKALGVIGTIKKKATEKEEKSMRSFIKLSENEATRLHSHWPWSDSRASDNTWKRLSFKNVLLNIQHILKGSDVVCSVDCHVCDFQDTFIFYWFSIDEEHSSMKPKSHWRIRSGGVEETHDHGQQRENEGTNQSEWASCHEMRSISSFLLRK